jgi:hypothetical protein
MSEEQHERKQQENSDPLAGAAIGETRTVRTSKTLYSIDLTPDEYFGTDRFPDHIDIADVELVETDDMSCGPDIRITWEGEVTKQLPSRWDYHREPVTEEEKRTARRKTWAKRLGSVGITVGTLAFTGWIAAHVMQQFAGVTINGEPMTVGSPTEIFVSMVPLLLVAALIAYGIQGGLPGMVGGRR